MKYNILHLYMIVIQNLVKKIMIRNSRWPHTHIWYKTFKRLLPKNQWADLADVLPEAYGTFPYISWLKSCRSDHKPTLSGWSKFGKMT